MTGDPTGNPFPPKPAPQPCSVPQDEPEIVELPGDDEEEKDDEVV